jgi:D-alanyl-D-alanine carboxypeptidase
MVRAADSYAVIREISVKTQADLEVGRKQRLRTLMIHNTNQQILIEFEGITVSKTGFTGAAGWCVAMMINKGRTKSVVVIMGAATPKQRHDKVNHIMLNHIADTEVDPQPEPNRSLIDSLRLWIIDRYDPQ